MAGFRLLFVTGQPKEANMRPLEHPHGYYRKREKQEREMAANANDAAVRQIHLALAERYRQLAEGDNSTSQ